MPGAGIVVGYELPEPGLVSAQRTHRSLVAAARTAAAGGVDYLVLPDRPAASPGGAAPPASVILASLLASATTRIGVVMSAAPAYYEPYNLARMVASLDHISGGRAGWQVVTGTDAAADGNQRRDGFDPAVDRAVRAAEFVPLVRDLWDTWEDGAFVHDKASGQFVDGGRIHALDHVGSVLKVRGPLNVVRPPQGHPVVFAPATDPLVCAAADVVIVGNPDSAVAAREAGAPLPIGVVTPFVAETEASARDRHAEAGTPAPDADRGVVVGDAGQVAARLAAWVDSGAVAGFTVRCALPGQLDAFTELVLPRLRRGHVDQRATSLRERLGLARPANRVVQRMAAERG